MEIKHYVFIRTSENYDSWILKFQGSEGECFKYLETLYPNDPEPDNRMDVKIVRDL